MRLVAEAPADEPMPEALTAELQRIDAFLAKATAQMVHVKEAQDAALLELPTEQLEAQLAAELIGAVKTWTAAQWAIVDKARPS
jgi:hypothetical protein